MRVMWLKKDDVGTLSARLTAWAVLSRNRVPTSYLSTSLSHNILEWNESWSFNELSESYVVALSISIASMI